MGGGHGTHLSPRPASALQPAARECFPPRKPKGAPPPPPPPAREAPGEAASPSAGIGMAAPGALRSGEEAGGLPLPSFLPLAMVAPEVVDAGWSCPLSAFPNSSRPFFFLPPPPNPARLQPLPPWGGGGGSSWRSDGKLAAGAQILQPAPPTSRPVEQDGGEGGAAGGWDGERGGEILIHSRIPLP